MAIVVSATYTGNGTSQTIAIPGSPGTPSFIWIKAATGARVPVAWTTTMGANATKPLSGATALTAGIITAVGSSTFDVGASLLSNAAGVTYYYVAIVDNGVDDIAAGSYVGTGAPHDVDTGIGIVGLTTTTFQFENNENGVTYHYLAMSKSTVLSVGTFTGDGTSSQNVTPFTFTPDACWSQGSAQASAAGIRFQDNVGDSSSLMGPNNFGADRIQAFIANGIQVGGSDAVNVAGDTYYAVGFKEGTSSGPTGPTLDLFLTMAATARAPGWKSSDMPDDDWEFSFASALVTEEGITLSPPPGMPFTPWDMELPRKYWLVPKTRNTGFVVTPRFSPFAPTALPFPDGQSTYPARTPGSLVRPPLNTGFVTPSRPSPIPPPIPPFAPPARRRLEIDTNPSDTIDLDPTV